MALGSPLLEAFNAGEFSPRMSSRIGFDKYRNAASVMKNMLALPQGGTMRRPGTRYVGNAWSNEVETTSRLAPFEFSTTDAYILEFSQGVLRPFREQNPILNQAVTCAITNGTFDSDISGWTDLSTGTGAIAYKFIIGGGVMELTAGATGEAIAEQSVTTNSTVFEHVLAFRVGGFPHVPAEVRIGTTSGGTDIFQRTVYPGFYSVSFTPSTTTFYLQFRCSYAGRSIDIDDVEIIQGEQTRVQTIYSTSDLPGLSYAQTADIMYITHENYSTYRLERRGHRDWSLIEVYWRDGPWLTENLTTTTLTPGATTGENVTVTASSTEGINDGGGFTSSDLGRSIRIQHGTNDHGWGTIVLINSTTSVDVAIHEDFNAITATDQWALGAWSNETGYPRTLTFFEDRLLLAGSTFEPQTFWGSQALGDYENMRPDSFVGSAVTVEADDAYVYTMAAERVNAIQWLVSGRELFIGTSGGEWVITAQGAAVTPLDIDVKRHTAHGSSATHHPVLAGGAVLFINRAQNKVHELAYSFDVDAYVAPDISILADHIGVSPLKEMAFQQNPDTIVWIVREDGVLATLTYRRAQNVVGWTRQIVGGSYGSGDAVVESVATIPGKNASASPQVYDSDDRDEVWISVLRTINGSTLRTIEVFEGFFTGPVKEQYDNEADFDAAMLAVQDEAFYVDAGYTYTGAATNTITGLTWLEGETVYILVEGATHSSRVVTGGSITLDASYTPVHVGLPYGHRYVSLKLPFGSAAGTGMTKRKTIRNIGLALLDTGPFQIGTSIANLKDASFREVGDAMDTAVPLFTGEIVENVEGGYSDDPRIIIDSDSPTPFVMLALVPEIRTHEAR